MLYIKFKKGYKYQLEEDFSMRADFLPPRHIDTYFIQFRLNGDLLLAKGYAWDGPTGVPDLSSFMRASLVHDALYQLMRNDHLDLENYRQPADRLMRKMCLQDGMNPLWAGIAYCGVRLLGESHARGSSKKELICAP